jgi:hypothetical protein
MSRVILMMVFSCMMLVAHGQDNNAPKKRAKEAEKVKRELNSEKQQLGSEARELYQSVNPKKIDSTFKTTGKQESSKAKGHVTEQKQKVKDTFTEVKKPVDFDLKMDNDGTEGKSVQKENIQKKLNDLKDFQGNPSPPSSTLNLKEPSIGDKKIPSSLSGLDQNNLDVKSKLGGVKGVDKFKQATDSISTLNSKTIFGSTLQILDANSILSQKQLMKLRDSLGVNKFDSLFNKASLLSKKEVGKEDLLEALNKSFAEKSKLDESTFEQKKVLGAAQEEVTGQTKDFDPLAGKLPQSVLQELPPLSGNMLDSKYLKLVDSLRKIKLKEQGLKLTEKEMSNGKEMIFQRKPKFWDKAYFDGILGVVGNDNVTIVQASPSLGYHIFPLFSLGIGPMLSVQKQNNGLNSSVGMRSFAKVELFKQRAYVQTEYQISPYQIDYKNVNLERGSFLIGGGVVKTVYGKMAINLSLMYKVNANEVLPGASPWVFRLGISSVKKIEK